MIIIMTDTTRETPHSALDALHSQPEALRGPASQNPAIKKIVIGLGAASLSE
jgi:hypothetical protein